MKRTPYSHEQINSVLKEHEADASVPRLSRRYGIVQNTIYCWKSKFSDMEVSETKRPRDLEQENAMLKRQLAEAELDTIALKELVEGKW